MTDSARDGIGTGNGTVIYPFPEFPFGTPRHGGESFDSQPGTLGRDSTDLTKEKLEALIATMYSLAIHDNPGRIDDPFDSVYIARLQPDDIPNHALESLIACHAIEDLSGTISFDDGWDD